MSDPKETIARCDEGLAKLRGQMTPEQKRTFQERIDDLVRQRNAAIKKLKQAAVSP